MTKAIITIIAVALLAAIIYTMHRAWKLSKHEYKNSETALTFCNLDHDIYIDDAMTTTICHEDVTGWKASCGPSPAGWPMAFPYKWEITLCEDKDFYYARLIYHEYVLWLSFDNPYVLCKIPKVRTSGDWATNESARYTALWNITRNFEMGWNTPSTIKEPQIYNINGHKVHFADDTYEYEKYVVVHDTEYPW